MEMYWGILLYALIGVVSAQESLGLFKNNKEPKQSAYGNRPRGVPYARGVFYSTGNTFACIDNSLTIPISHVNDDYCDCPDGSDEPGTSACANGKFYCLNRGDKAKEIPSGRVNDQICDCCDGSDEWNGAVECPNICEVVGAKRRDEHLQRIELAKKGFEKRQLLAEEALKLRSDKEAILNRLTAEKEAMNAAREQVTAKKNEIEAREIEAKKIQDDAWTEIKAQKKRVKAQHLFMKIDSNFDEKIDRNDLKNFKEIDQNSDGEVTDEEVKQVFGEKEECDFETFFEEVYDGIIMILKEAKAAQKAKENAEKAFESPEHDVESDALNINEGSDEGNKEMETESDEKHEAEYENEDEGSEDKENVENPVPSPLTDESDKSEYDDDDGEAQPPYDDATNKIIEEANEARKEFDDMESKFVDIELNISDAEAYVNGDYESDLAWLPLKKQCYSLEDRQYIYSLCLFDYAEQKDKNGHSATRLGSWAKWAGEEEEDKYQIQKYDKGVQCWNGPQRSTMVFLECAEETKLVEVSEPAKCEYRMVLESPAACPHPATIKDIHEEL